MNIPQNLLYTSDHEWVEFNQAKDRARVGITDFAQDALGDIVFVQVPEIGRKVQVGTSFSEVESTKSVSDIYSPVNGTVVEVNQELSDSPQKINSDPYGSGWICEIELSGELEESHLLDPETYQKLVSEG